MAAPPRQQQGPGGNVSLSPGGNGTAGSGGPPAAEGAGPAAGPELSRPQQYTIPGILHYIQHEWARFEMERAHWEVERAELQVPGRGRGAGRPRRRGSRGDGNGTSLGGSPRPWGRKTGGTYLCGSGGGGRVAGPGRGPSESPPPPSPQQPVSPALASCAVRASSGQPFWLLLWRLRGLLEAACWARGPGARAAWTAGR